MLQQSGHAIDGSARRNASFRLSRLLWRGKEEGKEVGTRYGRRDAISQPRHGVYLTAKGKVSGTVKTKNRHGS